MVGISDVEEVAGLGAKIGRKLRPPPDESPIVTAWRWFIVIVLTFDTVVGMGHIALACGLFPFLSHGFADYDEVQELKKSVLAVQIERMEYIIYNMRIRQCDAIDHGESPLLYTYQLADATKRYRSLTQHDPYIYSCAELELAQKVGSPSNLPTSPPNRGPEVGGPNNRNSQGAH